MTIQCGKHKSSEIGKNKELPRIPFKYWRPIYTLNALLVVSIIEDQSVIKFERNNGWGSLNAHAICCKFIYFFLSNLIKKFNSLLNKAK